MSDQVSRTLKLGDLKASIKSAAEGEGGFQSFCKKLMDQIEGDVLTIYQDDEQVGARCVINHGPDGWRDLLVALGFDAKRSAPGTSGQALKIRNELAAFVLSQFEPFTQSKKARLVIDGRLVAEAPMPGNGTPQFPGYRIEEPGEEEPNATVQVVAKHGSSQSYPVRATAL